MPDLSGCNGGLAPHTYLEPEITIKICLNFPYKMIHNVHLMERSCIISAISLKPSVTADSLMAYRTVADKPEPPQKVEVAPATQRDVISLSPPVDEIPLYNSGRLQASRQVEMHERDALRGSAGQQYSFSFVSDDTSRSNPSPATHKSDHRGSGSKQVTKREKKGLLNSGLNQYNLDLYE